MTTERSGAHPVRPERPSTPRLRRSAQDARGAESKGQRRQLRSDERGGVQFVAYLMLVAAIALIALAGARAYDRSARQSFERSTQRFAAPGTYVGGDLYTTRSSTTTIPSNLPPPPGPAVSPPSGGILAWLLDLLIPSAHAAEAPGYWPNDADRELSEQFRNRGDEYRTGDIPTDWYLFWCRGATPCTIDLADRNYNMAKGRLLRDNGYFERFDPAEVSPWERDHARGFGWKNIACFYAIHLPDYFSCTPWSPGLPPVRGVDFPTCTGLPVFDPNRRYCG